MILATTEVCQNVVSFCPRACTKEQTPTPNIVIYGMENGDEYSKTPTCTNANNHFISRLDFLHLHCIRRISERFRRTKESLLTAARKVVSSVPVFCKCGRIVGY